MVTAGEARLRLVRGAAPATVVRGPGWPHWWVAASLKVAAGLQVAVLLGGSLLFARQPAIPPPGLATTPAERAAPLPAYAPTYGPPLPPQVTAAALRAGRVTPYPPASVKVLLSAGDRAQLVGHPKQAISFYDQILRENPGDPRAPEAAFTAGRLLLHSLDRPRQAAERFAQARRLAPHGPLAEDALAQEIASWVRAGKTARARARAEEFHALYPTSPLPELVDVQGG